MQKAFAGFWRDGAVVQPDLHHLDADKTVLAKHKKDGAFDICGIGFRGWNAVYWLDTTTPTELTPQEAFELLKMIFPMLTGIEKDRQRDYTMTGDRYIEANVNWGDTTEYPPKQKWRVPTDADKGKRCRYKDEEKAEWMNRDNVLFMSTWNKGFWVVYGNEVPCFWKHCEVLDE